MITVSTAGCPRPSFLVRRADFARFVAIATALAIASGLAGGAVAEDGSGEQVRVAASERYAAGRVHRWALGGGYRDLWETPILLPLVDLNGHAGGLTPTGRFGGLQTAVLGLAGANGGAFTFRGTDKDPSAVLDPLLWDTLVQALVQDQMAAQHPGGPPVAGALTEAAGVLTIHETMAVVPDDARLGEYQEEFAGMVGTFFVYPQAASDGREGFADAEELIDHEALYERLRTNAEDEVDAQAFMRARLMDLLLGDFDRHRKQWRWAKLPGNPRWQPIPEDRDQAFVRYDGVAQRVMRIYIPILQNYGPEYPSLEGLTLHGWEQDRWLLPALSWEDWEAAATDIQSRLSDAAIADAVARLPEEYEALDGERLRRDIAGRRDGLLEIARRFYLHLAGRVDVRLSDAAESISVRHEDDGSMAVEVQAERAGRRQVVFSRRFLADETKEVRLYLRSGADQVDVSGGKCGILLRVIAGDPSQQVAVTSPSRVRVYDESGNVTVEPGKRTRRIGKSYTPPPPDAGFVDVEDVPPRDWGSRTVPLPEFGFQPDVGVFLGAAVSHTRYGFRKDPWSSKHSFGVGWAFEANEPRVRYRGQFRPENSDLVAQVELKYSGIEVLRFHGFGNESPDSNSDFRVQNQFGNAEFSLIKPLPDDRVTVRGGAFFRVSDTRRNAGREIVNVAPYGVNSFKPFLYTGLVGGIRFDTRRSVTTTKQGLQLPFHDNPAAGYPTSGILIDVSGRFAPQVLDVADPYGYIEGSIAGYFSFGENDWATLALRVGGKETFGRTPFFDQATIGGGRFFSGDSTNRGLEPRRFTGDSAVFGNADLRLVLGRAKIIVPGEWGIHGFFDVGRVFFHDENSDDWHPTGGGGVFFSPLVRTNAISFSVTDSAEETLVYLRIGFHY